VNSGSVIISAIAVIGDRLSNNSIIFKIFGAAINPLGIVIVIASLAALISKLGYWRYYEYCDMLGKYYRALYLPDTLRDTIKAKIESGFRREHPLLNRVPVHAHHYVWLSTQVAFFVIGLNVAFYTKA
jgi:hypothetical protein